MCGSAFMPAYSRVSAVGGDRLVDVPYAGWMSTTIAITTAGIVFECGLYSSHLWAFAPGLFCMRGDLQWDAASNLPCASVNGGLLVTSAVKRYPPPDMPTLVHLAD